MKLIPLVLFFVFLATGARAQVSGGTLVGDRPPDSVFDPAGVLTEVQREEISTPLQTLFKDEGIDVLVIILPDIGEAPANHVARGYAEKWGRGQIQSVVLHVPGQKGTPSIFPGSAMIRAIKPEIMRTSIQEAEKRAASESTDFGKVRAASVEAADALRYWMGGAVLRSEQRISEGLRQRLAHEERRRMLKLSAFLGLAALIPLTLGLVMLVVGIKNRRPKRFPLTRKVPRLGAPYAGGNNSVINLDSHLPNR